MLGGFGAEANDNLLVEGELRSISNRRQKNRYERAFLGCSRRLLRLRTFNGLGGVYGGFPLKRLGCLLRSCLAVFCEAVWLPSAAFFNALPESSETAKSAVRKSRRERTGMKASEEVKVRRRFPSDIKC